MNENIIKSESLHAVDEIVSLLGKEIACSDEFLVVLEEERQAILKMDVATLVTISRRKMLLLDRLQDFDKSVEKRVEFLKDLLTFNGFEVRVQEEKGETEDAPVTYTLGVTDIIFNPVIAVYQMRLKTKEGKKVSPAYWNQYTNKIDNRYWRFWIKLKKD